MSSNGFVDLRLNGSQSGDEGFWPSFTDIMMVIVLIFLLAMLTLLLKNMDLVHQLRASLVAERAATEQVHSTTDLNTRLNQRLKRLEEEAGMLRMRLMNLGEEHSRSLAQLAERSKQNLKLQSGLAAATQARDVALAENRDLLAKQNTLSELLAQRARQLAEQQQQYEQQLAEKQRLSEQQLEQIGALKGSNEMQLARLKQIEQEYAQLESKYRRLIRPARSPLGKVVTLVRYHKADGKLLIEIKAPSESEYSAVNGTELHRRLSKLQGKFGKKLYVRIIFPDDSGLSYTEAWNLTESLLRMYDYYYQE